MTKDHPDFRGLLILLCPTMSWGVNDTAAKISSFVSRDRLAYLRKEADFYRLANAIRGESRVTHLKIELARSAVLKGSSRPLLQLEVNRRPSTCSKTSPYASQKNPV